MKVNYRLNVALMMIALCFVFNQEPSFADEKQNYNPDETNIQFQWAFVAIKNPAKDSQVVRITKKMVLDTGDKIKFYLNLKESCFLYLIHHSSQNELRVLFPDQFKPLNKKFVNLDRHYIPKGKMWFQLDEHIGQETFYLLASVKRLYGLEKFLNDYKTADNTSKAEQVDKVLTEIQKFQRQQLKLRYVERPVAIIGGIRTAQKKINVGIQDPADFADEISAIDFFSKVFTIDHK